jgi:DnaK suppressor protein
MTKKALSETDLLAAPKDYYMNEAQLQFFRQRLLSLRSQLLENVRDTTQHLHATEAASDPSDRATQEEEQAVELRTRDRERKLLKKIDEALERITAGTYGFCKDTGERIGIRRLLARPTATLSVEAQDKRERTQRQFAD